MSKRTLTEHAKFVLNLAAMAPQDIPMWFKHTPPSKDGLPPAPDQDKLTEEDKITVGEWQTDPCYDLPDHLQWYQKQAELRSNSLYDWEQKNKEARYFQWRSYYAHKLAETLNIAI